MVVQWLALSTHNRKVAGSPLSLSEWSLHVLPVHAWVSSRRPKTSNPGPRGPLSYMFEKFLLQHIWFSDDITPSSSVCWSRGASKTEGPSHRRTLKTEDGSSFCLYVCFRTTDLLPAGRDASVVHAVQGIPQVLAHDDGSVDCQLEVGQSVSDQNYDPLHSINLLTEEYVHGLKRAHFL